MLRVCHLAACWWGACAGALWTSMVLCARAPPKKGYCSLGKLVKFRVGPGKSAACPFLGSLRCLPPCDLSATVIGITPPPRPPKILAEAVEKIQWRLFSVDTSFIFSGGETTSRRKIYG